MFFEDNAHKYILFKIPSSELRTYDLRKIAWSGSPVPEQFLFFPTGNYFNRYSCFLIDALIRTALNSHFLDNSNSDSFLGGSRTLKNQSVSCRKNLIFELFQSHSCSQVKLYFSVLTGLEPKTSRPNAPFIPYAFSQSMHTRTLPEQRIESFGYVRTNSYPTKLGLAKKETVAMSRQNLY